MGQAKQRRAEIDELKKQTAKEMEWHDTLSIEEKAVLAIVSKFYERIILQRNLTEAAFLVTCFLKAYIRNTIKLDADIVIGWVKHAGWETAQPHAWLVFHGKQIDLSLHHTVRPEVHPAGSLVLLGRSVAEGTVAYEYFSDLPAEATSYLSEYVAANPEFGATLRARRGEYENMRELSKTPEGIQQYLDGAPPPVKYDKLAFLVNG